MIKACIFDLDGTIADTLESMAYVANEIMEKFSLKPQMCIRDRHCRGSVGKLKAIFEKSKYLFPFEYKSIKIIFIRSRIRKETKLWQRSINIGDLLQ